MVNEFRSFCYALLVLVLVSGVCTVFVIATRSYEVYSSEHVTSEGTVTNKQVSSHLVSAYPPVHAKRYRLTVSIADNTYSLAVPCDTYNSIEVGDSLMFDLACKDGKVVAVSIATAESLTELVTE